MAPHTSGQAESPATPMTSHSPHEGGDEPPRSGYGLIPGAELPGAVYIAALLAYVWMLGAAWLAFGSNDELDLNLGIATVLTIVIFALPALIVRTATTRAPNASAPTWSARRPAIYRYRKPACRSSYFRSCWRWLPPRSALFSILSADQVGAMLRSGV